MIDRQNIISLIGADSRRYHSCILTCYSFDFLFFEQRLLPRLRQAGIQNINVLVDARMYENQMQQLDGNTLNPTKSYSITPIRIKGAFHPKILFVTGKSHGFLGIGSGNLTNSGLSSNDEIWGAIHTYQGETESAAFFASVWTYLDQFKHHVFGTNRSKLQWSVDGAPWLSQMIKNGWNPGFIETKDEERVKLVDGSPKSFPLSDFFSTLPDKRPKAVKMLSPFYNRKGDVITEIVGRLEPQRTIVVVDSRFGTVPYQIAETNTIEFYSWESLGDSSKKISPRLHAKAIQIEYDGETFLLLGSMNLTKEAMGLKETPSKNAELGLLLHSNVPRDYLSEMGVDFENATLFEISDYKVPQSDLQSPSSVKWLIFIQQAELSQQTLFLYLDQTLLVHKDYYAEITNRQGAIHRLKMDKDETLILELDIPESLISTCLKVSICNENGDQLSNSALIHDTQRLLGTNPDSKKQRLLELLSASSLEDEGLYELLQYDLFSRPQVRKHSSQFSPRKTESMEDDDHRYNLMSEEEFNKGADQLKGPNMNHISDLGRVEEFLNSMLFGERAISKKDYKDNPDDVRSKHKEDGTAQVENLESGDIEMSFSKGKKYKEIYHKTLLKIHNLIKELTEESRLDSDKATRGLEALLVGSLLIFNKINEHFIEDRTDLLVSYGSKKDLVELESQRALNISRKEQQTEASMSQVAYTIDWNARDKVGKIADQIPGICVDRVGVFPTIKNWHKFYAEGPIIDKRGAVTIKSIKGFIVNTYCRFLSCLGNAEAQLDPVALKRSAFHKKRLLNRMLLLMLMIHWKNKEETIFRLTLLNSFWILGSESTDIEAIIEDVDTLQKKLGYHSRYWEQNRLFFISLLKKHHVWLKVSQDSKTALVRQIQKHEVGKCVFKGSCGFGVLTSFMGNTISLMTPLGKYESDINSFQLKVIHHGTKALFFD